MASSDAYYRPSGAVPLASLPLGLGLGVLSAAALGVAYGFATQYSPSVELNVAFMLGFGAVIGAVAAVGMRQGKLRAPLVAGALGSVVGAVAVYIAWVAWVGAFTQRGGETWWPWLPWELLSAVLQVNENGAWSIDGGPLVTGIPLWICWGVEALGVLGMSAGVSWSRARLPFCEGCQEWAKKQTTLGFGPPLAKEALRLRVEAGDLAALAVNPITPGHSTQVTIWQCPGDEGGFISADHTETGTGRRNQAMAKALFRHLRVTPAQLAELRALKSPTLTGRGPLGGVAGIEGMDVPQVDIPKVDLSGMDVPAARRPGEGTMEIEE